MLPSNYINRDKMILGVVIMSLFNIPDGVDVIEVRKKVNKMLSEGKLFNQIVRTISVSTNKEWLGRFLELA